MARKGTLTPAQWEAIRKVWEYDPSEPTYRRAAEIAGAKFGFDAPAKQVVDRRAKAEQWERKAHMTGINAAAQRKADAIGPLGDEGDAAGVVQGDASPGKKAPAAGDAAPAMSLRNEAEDLRAAVLARHRDEWKQVATLRQEALLKRPRKVNGVKVDGSVPDAFESAKLAKITAEMTAIQQAGERKAWGLDVVVDPDQMKNLSDDDLKALAEGRAPRR